MIWRSRWITDTGIIECREALAFPGDPHRVVAAAPDQRRATATPGSRSSWTRAAGFGRQPLDELHRDDDGVWTGRVGELYLRWTGAATPGARRPRRQQLRHRGHRAGATHHDLVLETQRPAAARRAAPTPTAAWRATETAWHETRARAADTIARARDARARYAVLRGLTSAGGGMVAAATTSLPERAEAGRNYDYRYVWIRDQCYAGQAVAAAGAAPAARRRRPLRRRTGCSTHGDRARARLHHHRRPGARPAPPRPARLPGRLRHRRQLGQPAVPARRLRRGAAAVRRRRPRTTGSTPSTGRPPRPPPTAIEQPLARTRRRDLGARRPALDALPADLRRRAARHRRRRSPRRRRRAAGSRWPTPSSPTPPADCLHPDGRWQRAPDDPGVDAALLLPALRGALPADDPRTLATYRAVHEQLGEDGYAYRFRHDDRPLANAEGRSCSADSSWRWPHTSRASRSRRPAGSNATAPPAGRRACSARSTTSPSTSCAATSRRPSSTP